MLKRSGCIKPRALKAISLVEYHRSIWVIGWEGDKKSLRYDHEPNYNTGNAGVFTPAIGAQRSKRVSREVFDSE